MAVSVKEAINILSNQYKKPKYEIVPIENALNKISAESLFATQALPKFNNSAMDGYAILFEDTHSKLKITSTIFAGDNKDIELISGQCVKIMTGAKIPKNCTAIIPFEDAKIINETTVCIPSKVKENQHIRYIGEDIQIKDNILKEGDEINFSKITLLSSQGISHVKVFKKPNIVVFASGEELKLHYEKIEDYQIYNSNTPTFIARCQELGCDVTFIGQARDSIDSIKESIQNSLGADLIITSGGVSVGEADFTKEAFNALGFESLFDGIIVKPGKPTVFGKIGNTLILNLPGNPLAASLIFELFGKILIQKLLGQKECFHNTIDAKMHKTLKNKKGRITVVPGFFDGVFFQASNKRSPGMVSILASCNAMIVLDENVEHIEENKTVKVLPINWKFFTQENKDFLTHE
ncbi:MAG: molybdopterin molybdotransferase MoeA [Candidatus Marinarcus sp.]|uniref:molybdopterin molybdotransferase MoeA n=1 Tax=Candidatus Marinarcus sp. TaxID=3100987 RepID=UPI003AFF835F